MTVAAPAVWPTPRGRRRADPRRSLTAPTRSPASPTRTPTPTASVSALGVRASRSAPLGRTVRVVVPEPLPRLLEHLPGFETVEVGGAPLGDTVFTFDCATLGRFGERRAEVEHAGTVVNIDHHLSNTGFGTINLVDAHASATGQVIYRLLEALGAPISPSVATNLYAALFTDTGGFRHENTTEAALRLAASLVAAGADPGWVALKSYKSRSLAQVRLEGMAIAEHALRARWTPALVRGDRARCSSRPAPICRTPRASSTPSRASAPWRSRSSSRRRRPPAPRSACARAIPSMRPTSARRSVAAATAAPRAPSSPIRFPTRSARCSRLLAG